MRIAPSCRSAARRALAAAAAACLAAGLVASSGLWARGSETAVARILYPGHLTAHASPIDVMVGSAKEAQQPRLTVDGRPVALSRMAFADTWLTPGALERITTRLGDRQERALWTGRLKLRPGKHTLALGAARVRLFSGAAAPRGWSTAHTHPPVSPQARAPQCGCHGDDPKRLDASRTPQACEACHSDVQVQLIHKHVTPPLARCGMCHDPHGAPLPGLLVAPKAQLCVKCHSAGHSKG